MKRYLFLLHRWLGILLCIFMALWFVSGVVMMYVGYPKLTQQERLAGLPALSSADCCISVSAARKALTLDSPIQGVRLTSVGGSRHRGPVSARVNPFPRRGVIGADPAISGFLATSKRNLDA